MRARESARTCVYAWVYACMSMRCAGVVVHVCCARVHVCYARVGVHVQLWERRSAKRAPASDKRDLQREHQHLTKETYKESTSI